jgi:hypothetical protein
MTVHGTNGEGPMASFSDAVDKALASIALALSAIHHGGINHIYDPDVD